MEIGEDRRRGGVAAVEEGGVVAGSHGGAKAYTVPDHGYDGCFWVRGAVEDVVENTVEVLIFSCGAKAV